MEMTEKMKQKIENGREYRNLTLEASDENDSYIVEGYATTFDQPYHLYYTKNGKGEKIEVREMVSRDAFANTDSRDTILQFDHEGKVYARVSNDTLKLSVDDHGLFVRAYLGGTEIGRNLYEEIKGGYINKMSFGFTVDEDEMKPEGDGYLRTIKSVGKLFDVSAVSIPANDYTEISARNHIDGAIDEIEAERLRLEEERRALAEQKENLLKKLKGLKGEPNEH